MAKVNRIVWDKSPDGYHEVPTKVKVGDHVGFKSDIEQSGKITKIEGDWLTLENSNGFGGDYLRYATVTKQHASDCWL